MTETDWHASKAELAASFAAFLGQELVPVWEPRHEDSGPDGGFSCGVRSADPVGGPLRLEFYAVVSVSPGRSGRTWTCSCSPPTAG